jgi:hypothetical protein
MASMIGTFGRNSEMKGMSKAERNERFALGMEIARYHARPGVAVDLRTLAEFCGCTSGLIYEIEQRALRKLRRLYREDLFRRDDELGATASIPPRYRLAREAAAERRVGR